MTRAQQIAAVALVLAAVAGCASVGRLDESPKHVIDLSGNWTLNRTLSDDPKPVLEKLRPKPIKRGDLPPDEIDDDPTGPVGAGGQQQPGGGGGQRQGRSRRGGAQAPLYAYRNNNDAYTHSTVLKILSADLARADNLTIRQSSERFALDYGSAVRSFTPGSVSVVSAAWGVADQSSGWKGKDFIIRVKPQEGVASVETYSLSPDGQHLIEELRLGGGEFPAVSLKRTYDRSDHPVSRSVPTSD